MEMSLAQKCQMAIRGESGYGDLLVQHMCCGFPMAPRGNALPKKCLCPPTVTLAQYGFECKTGNKLFCSNVNVGGDITRPLNEPSNMAGANFSMTKDAYRNNPDVRYKIFERDSKSFPLNKLKTNPDTLKYLKTFMENDLQLRCKYEKKSYCHNFV